MIFWHRHPGNGPVFCKKKTGVLTGARFAGVPVFEPGSGVPGYLPIPGITGEYKGTGVIPGTLVTNWVKTFPLPGHQSISRYRGLPGNTKVPGSSPVPRLQTGARLLLPGHLPITGITWDYRGTGVIPGTPVKNRSNTGVYSGTGVNPDTPVTNRGNTSPLRGYRGISRYRGYRGMQRYWGLPR